MDNQLMLTDEAAEMLTAMAERDDVPAEWLIQGLIRREWERRNSLAGSCDLTERDAARLLRTL